MIKQKYQLSNQSNKSTISPFKQSPIKNYNFGQRMFASSKFSPKTSLGLSPRAQNVSLFKLPQNEDYKNIKQLKLNEQKQQKINYLLSIDEETRKGYEERQKNNQYYLNYEINPFTIQGSIKVKNQQNKNKQNKKYKKQQKTNKQNKKHLVQAFSQIHQLGQINHFTKRYKSKFSEIDSIVNLRKSDKKQNKQVQSKQLKNTDKNNLIKQIFQLFPRIINQYLDLQQIMTIKQQNFFVNDLKNKQFNIFDIIKHPNHPSFDSSYQKLVKNRFCFDSIIVKGPTSISASMNRALTKQARISVINMKSKNINKQFILKSSDFVFDLQKIDVAQILLTSAGQLLPQLAYAIINNQTGQNNDILKIKQNQDEQSLQKQQQIVYKQASKNYIFNTGSIELDKAQLQYYKKQTILPIQRQQQILCDKYKDALTDMINEQIKLKSYAIKDKNVIKNNQKQKCKLITEQFQANIDSRNPAFAVDIGKKIRMNKIYKNQSQNIRLKSFSKTLKQLKDTSILYKLNLEKQKQKSITKRTLKRT